MGRTRKLFYDLTAFFSAVIFASFPTFVLALGDTQGSCKKGEIETAFGCITEGGGALADFIQQVYVVALFLGSTIAVIMVVIGGIQYITSSGNPDAVQSAKDRITSALLGLALLVLAIILFRTIGVGQEVL